MDQEIIIDENDLVLYIQSKIELTKEEIQKVLDLEFEYLKLKGVRIKRKIYRIKGGSKNE